MSIDDDQSVDDVREAEVVLDSKMKLKGDVIRNAAGDLIVKLTGRQIKDLEAITGPLSKEGEPVAILAHITDSASSQLLEQGQTLFAWVRVKRSDKSFVTRTALFSLGAVAAVTITRRAIRHYQSR